MSNNWISFHKNDGDSRVIISKRNENKSRGRCLKWKTETGREVKRLAVDLHVAVLLDWRGRKRETPESIIRVTGKPNCMSSSILATILTGNLILVSHLSDYAPSLLIVLYQNCPRFRPLLARRFLSPSPKTTLQYSHLLLIIFIFIAL